MLFILVLCINFFPGCAGTSTSRLEKKAQRFHERRMSQQQSVFSFIHELPPGETYAAAKQRMKRRGFLFREASETRTRMDGKKIADIKKIIFRNPEFPEDEYTLIFQNSSEATLQAAYLGVSPIPLGSPK